MYMREFVLKQVTKFMWTIELSAGIVICKERHFNNQYQAEQFCKAFISSWQSTNYIVETLEEDK